MSRSTFLRIRYVLTSPFWLFVSLFGGAIEGLVDGARTWWSVLTTSLKDPIAAEEDERKAEREMMGIVGTFDTHP